MNLIKFVFLPLLLFSLFSFADSAARMELSEMATNKMVSTDGLSSPAHTGFGISENNRLYAKVSYALSLIVSVATLIFLFIARRNVKTDYKKARKFFTYGLILFVLAVLFFLAAKLLFLSPSFPGNFDIRAT